MALTVGWEGKIFTRLKKKKKKNTPHATGTENIWLRRNVIQGRKGEEEKGSNSEKPPKCSKLPMADMQ
jgi:hypothetical protein